MSIEELIRLAALEIGDLIDSRERLGMKSSYLTTLTAKTIVYSTISWKLEKKEVQHVNTNS